MKVSNFEELRIWQQARELCKDIYVITRDGDFKWDSRFVQQIRAASGSVMDNIAEGFERDGNKEFVNFLYIAKGSCGEVRSQIVRAHDVGFIDEERYNELYNKCICLSKGISTFIQSIRQSKIAGPKYLEPQT